MTQLYEISDPLTSPKRPRKVVGKDGAEQRLRDAHFERVHRNALVNVNHVRKISRVSNRQWLLTLSSHQEFIVSKRRVPGLLQLLRG